MFLHVTLSSPFVLSVAERSLPVHPERSEARSKDALEDAPVFDFSGSQAARRVKGAPAEALRYP